MRNAESRNPIDQFRYCYCDPTSHERLRWQVDCTIAEHCGRKYTIVNGVPHFLRYEPVESTEQRDQLARMNVLAKEVGWCQAVHEIYGEGSRQARYILDESRAIYLDLLPLSSSHRALEIGASMGQHTVHLARRVGELFAIEVVSEQALFAAERCRQEGVANASIACGGDDCRLPYVSNSFDFVILHLVFEWCGSRAIDISFQEAQGTLLHETVRVLRPGGLMYLATKNRFALRLLKGGRDEHVAGMRFGNALPRRLMNLGKKVSGRGHPEGILYSHKHLKRLVVHAGLREIQSFWAIPDVRYPEAFVSIDARSIRVARKGEQFKRAGSRFERMILPLLPAAAVRHVMPGHVFIARKPQKQLS